MDPDPRMLEAINAAGGDLASGVGAQTGRPRRATPVPQIFYPFQGELLQHSGKQAAAGRRVSGELTEALTGIIERADYEATFGVSRAPIGHTVDPFFKVRVERDMPFNLSSVTPYFEDPKLNAEFQKRLLPHLRAGKYGATEPDIKGAARLLQQMSTNEPFRILVRQGLAAGPSVAAPLTRDAFGAALLLSSMATQADAPMPTVADLNSGRAVIEPGVVYGGRAASQWSADVPGRRSIGRSNRMMDLFGELAILHAKGPGAGTTMRPGGPLSADALRMFMERIGPSVGLRKKRGVENPPLTTFIGAFPETEQMRERGRRDISAELAYANRGAAVEEIRKMSPEQRLTLVEDAIKARLSPAQYRGLEGNIGSTKLSPEQRMKALLRELDQLEGLEGAGASRQIMEEVAQSGTARASRGRAPSMTRGGTAAREANILTDRQAQKMLASAEKRMKIKTSNPLATIALAAILSSAMLAYGYSGEEAA